MVLFGFLSVSVMTTVRVAIGTHMSPVINTLGEGTSLGKIKGKRFEILQFLFEIVKNDTVLL
jgi:hypothetical protein